MTEVEAGTDEARDAAAATDGAAAATDTSNATDTTDTSDTATDITVPDPGLAQAFIAVVLVGAGLTLTARPSALALLVAVAAAQALLGAAWVFGTVMPGRWGGLAIAGLAAAGADVAVSLQPHERLGVLAPVLGLAIPAVFVHQLFRGAARVQVVASMGAVATLAAMEVALAALLQTRHEFRGDDTAGTVAAAVVASIGVALAVGFVADLVLPAPRFDADVRRGLVAVVLSTVAGGAIGVLMLRDEFTFGADRGGFVGAALGVLAALMSVACSFVLHTTPVPAAAWAARLRPLLSALVPYAVLAPVAFLLCIAIRT